MVNKTTSEFIELPQTDTWGLVILNDHPLAKKDYITLEDLHGLEIICSEQALKVDIPR